MQFGFTVFLILLPIALSGWIVYNILIVIAQVGFLIIMIVAAVDEEKVNLRKWEDEYRRYQREVSMYNFIKGLWDLRKR